MIQKFLRERTAHSAHRTSSIHPLSFSFSFSISSDRLSKMTSKIEPKQVKSYLRELESDAKGFLLTVSPFQSSSSPHANHSPSLPIQHVDENVNWTVSTPATGPQGKTTPFSGICTSRKQFIEEVLIPLNGYFRDDSPLKMEISEFYFEIIKFIHSWKISDTTPTHLSKQLTFWSTVETRILRSPRPVPR